MVPFTEEHNETFKQVYLDCLNCRTELIQFSYPYEVDGEDYAVIEHLNHCKLILAEYLLDKIPGIARELDISLTSEELNELIGDRSNYVMEVVSPDVEKFVEEIRVIYIG